MIIDFNQIPTQTLPNFKGGEKCYIAEMFDDADNKIMRGLLEPGASIGMHQHESTSEIMFFVSGEGTVITDEGTETVKAGECHYCPQGTSHSLINTGTEPLRFFAVVPKHHKA